MATKANSYIAHYEDNYDGVEHESFDDLRAVAQEFWLDPLLSRWNIPIWIDASEVGRVQVGCLLSRHGGTIIHIAPCTPEQHQELAAIVMQVWIGRAEGQFGRYPALPETS